MSWPRDRDGPTRRPPGRSCSLRAWSASCSSLSWRPAAGAARRRPVRRRSRRVWPPGWRSRRRLRRPRPPPPRAVRPTSARRSATRSRTASRTAAPPARSGGGGGGPSSISIPAVGIQAPVVPIGVDAEGSVAIPTTSAGGLVPLQSPLPSTAGSTVLVGHVDSAEQGAGAFFRLHTLAAGNTVTVRLPTAPPPATASCPSSSSRRATCRCRGSSRSPGRRGSR